MSSVSGGQESPRRAAVVTGAGSGIGLAIAERLAAEGLAVAVLDRDAVAADAAAGKIEGAGGVAVPVTADVSDRPQVDAAVGAVREALGAPTVLVNNAGVDGFDAFLDISVEKWERLLTVNLTGTFHCCQAVLPHMIEAGWGRIVNITSSSAQGGQPRMAHYVSSKAGVVGLTQTLALEFGPRGITANAVPPSFIDTPMLRAADEKGLLGPGMEHHVTQTPVRRAGRPEDIAAMCAFLVSEEAGYVTGQVIGVNGGRKT